MISIINISNRSRPCRLKDFASRHSLQLRFASSSSNLVGRILHHEWVVNGKVVSSKNSTSTSLDDNLQTVIFLHGLLGNGKNLRSPAKKLTEHNPNLKALLLDLRGHGQSSTKQQLVGISNSSSSSSLSTEDHTIQNCALDIMETAKHLNLTGPTQSPIGIVGHSFGGRCALQYLSHIQKNHQSSSHSSSSSSSSIKPPKYTWLLDTVPGQAHSSVSNVIQALRNIDLSRIKNKQELVEILTKEEKIEKSIAQWMTTNLKKKENDDDKNSFEFMFDLDVAIGVLNDFPKQDFMQLVKDCTSMGTSSSTNHHNDNDKVYLVMGGKNKAWTDEIISEFKWLEDNDHHKMELVSLPKAGHWVHVDDLDGLMDAMNSCFRNI